jgi:lactobin A/cerein 7B family class IIb bacteriocin
MEYYNELTELQYSDLVEIEGGIAPVILYGGALLLGMAVGAAIRYYAK